MPGERVLFAGLADGHLRADGNSVGLVRELLAAKRIVPDVVITHTQADSHNDHVEAHRLAHAVVRECVFLHYSIHVSCELDTFAPRVFVEVADARLERKNAALARHRSQQGRIKKSDLSKYEVWLGALARLNRAEGLEVGFQGSAEKVLPTTIALSDSPFHRFWLPVVGEGEITLLYEGYGTPVRLVDWSAVHASIGRDRLRQAFIDQWAPAYPLRERYANGPDAAYLARSGSVILTGNAANNVVMREVYNAHATWTTSHDGLSNQDDGRMIHPEYSPDRGLRRDVGLVARISRPGASVVCAAGATGFATRIALGFLADPGSAPFVLAGCHDVQAVFSVEVASGQIEVLDMIND